MFKLSYDVDITVKFKKHLSYSDFKKIVDFFKLCRTEDKKVPGDKVGLFVNSFNPPNGKLTNFINDKDVSSEKQEFNFYINYLSDYYDVEDGYLILDDPNEMQQDFLDSVKSIACATPDLDELLSPSDVIAIWEEYSIEKQNEKQQEAYWDYLRDADERAYERWVDLQIDAKRNGDFESMKVQSVVNKILEGNDVRTTLAEFNVPIAGDDYEIDPFKNGGKPYTKEAGPDCILKLVGETSGLDYVKVGGKKYTSFRFINCVPGENVLFIPKHECTILGYYPLTGDGGYKTRYSDADRKWGYYFVVPDDASGEACLVVKSKNYDDQTVDFYMDFNSPKTTGWVKSKICYPKVARTTMV